MSQRTDDEWIEFFKARVPGPWTQALSAYELEAEIGGFARAVREELIADFKGWLKYDVGNRRCAEECHCRNGDHLEVCIDGKFKP